MWRGLGLLGEIFDLIESRGVGAAGVPGVAEGATCVAGFQTRLAVGRQARGLAPRSGYEVRVPGLEPGVSPS